MSVVINGSTGINTIEPTIVPAALSASGSAPVYAARAWVNFNGTGTVAIRASGNVSSITDNGTGDYTVNFTNAMTDVNYSVSLLDGEQGDIGNYYGSAASNLTTTSVKANVFRTDSFARIDRNYVSLAIFR